MNTPTSSSPKSPKCVACQESIQVNATVCPHCGTVQAQVKGQVNKKIFKWFLGSAGVISVVMAWNSIFALVSSWREEGAAIQQLIAEAEANQLLGSFDFAWEKLAQAYELDPFDETIRRAQIDLAIKWLMESPLYWGVQPPAEGVKVVIPILTQEISSAETEVSATLRAMLVWAYLQQIFASQNVAADLSGILTDALTIDSENPIANAVHGFYHILENGVENGNLKFAQGQFQKALIDESLSGWVRMVQNDALRYQKTIAESLPIREDREEKLSIVLPELLRVANQMRINGEELPPLRRRTQAILRCYGWGKGEYIDIVMPALLPEEHALTVDWLIDRFEFSSGDPLSQQCQFVKARMFLEMDRKEEALKLFLKFAEQDFFFEDLNVRVDHEIEKITGAPTPREIKRRARKFYNDEEPAEGDLWVFHEETLLNFDPTSPGDNYFSAGDFFIGGLLTGNLDGRVQDIVDLYSHHLAYVLNSVEQREAQRRKYGGALTGTYGAGRVRNGQLSIYNAKRDHAFIALLASEFDRSIREFRSLLISLRPSEDFGIDENDLEDFRINAHYNLACSFSLRSAIASDSNKDKASAVDHLQKAIELGFSQWETIVNDSDLDPLRNYIGFKDLMAGY